MHNKLLSRSYQAVNFENLALSGHDVYVLSGPIFEGAEIKQLKGRVMVPTSLFKAVYDATTKQAGVYLTPNTPEHTYMLVSVTDVATKVGIDPFPSIPSEAKVATIAVIEPSRRTNCGSQN